jgi:hypothetical protein
MEPGTSRSVARKSDHQTTEAVHLSTYRPLRSKTILVTGHGRPSGYYMSMLPYIVDNRLVDGGEFPSLTLQSPFTSVDRRATLWLEGLCELKNPMPSSGMKMRPGGL